MASRLFDISELNRLVDERYVSVQKHPSAELYIYNYGPKVQYERVWNDVTMHCRGLILDKDMNIVARPFRKVLQPFRARPFGDTGPRVRRLRKDGRLHGNPLLARRHAVSGDKGFVRQRSGEKGQQNPVFEIQGHVRPFRQVKDPHIRDNLP